MNTIQSMINITKGAPLSERITAYVIAGITLCLEASKAFLIYGLGVLALAIAKVLPEIL
jgi:hypothetical protein